MPRTRRERLEERREEILEAKAWQGSELELVRIKMERSMNTLRAAGQRGDRLAVEAEARHILTLRRQQASIGLGVAQIDNSEALVRDADIGYDAQRIIVNTGRTLSLINRGSDPTLIVAQLKGVEVERKRMHHDKRRVAQATERTEDAMRAEDPQGDAAKEQALFTQLVEGAMAGAGGGGGRRRGAHAIVLLDDEEDSSSSRDPQMLELEYRLHDLQGPARQ